MVLRVIGLYNHQFERALPLNGDQMEIKSAKYDTLVNILNVQEFLIVSLLGISTGNNKSSSKGLSFCTS